MKAFYCCLHSWSSPWSWSSSNASCVPKGHNFGAPAYFILFTASYMRYYEYYIIFINTITKIQKCLCMASFPGHIYIEKLYPCLLTAFFFTPSNVSWSTAWLSHGQSINFFDEHGILTQDSRGWFLQINYIPFFFFSYDVPGKFYIMVYATTESVMNILQIAGSDNWIFK